MRTGDQIIVTPCNPSAWEVKTGYSFCTLATLVKSVRSRFSERPCTHKETAHTHTERGREERKGEGERERLTYLNGLGIQV